VKVGTGIEVPFSADPLSLGNIISEFRIIEGHIHKRLEGDCPFSSYPLNYLLLKGIHLLPWEKRGGGIFGSTTLMHITEKSPLAPLFQRGVNSSLWKREVRRDFLTIKFMIS